MIFAEFGEHGTSDELRCGGMPDRTAVHAENMEWDELIPGIYDAFVVQLDRAILELDELRVIDVNSRRHRRVFHPGRNPVRACHIRLFMQHAKPDLLSSPGAAPRSMARLARPFFIAARTTKLPSPRFFPQAIKIIAAVNIGEKPDCVHCGSPVMGRARGTSGKPVHRTLQFNRRVARWDHCGADPVRCSQRTKPDFASLLFTRCRTSALSSLGGDRPHRLIAG